MSETNNAKQAEKAARIRRKPERESVLRPTFAAARQAVPDLQPGHPCGGGLLQRQCSCGKHTIGGGLCEECRQQGETSSPAPALDDGSPGAPPDVQTSRANSVGFDLSRIPPRTRLIANGHPLQPALTVNAPGDQYEQEADQVAEAVMRMPASPFLPAQPTISNLPFISRIQASGGNGAFQAPPQVETSISQMQGAGQPLPVEEQRFFEERMGYDFSRVRVHTDSNAIQASRDIQARAFTVGNNIAFNAGAYQPGTAIGRRLLAHELAHVVQQGSGKVQPEFAENWIAQNFALATSTAPSIQRQDEENKLDQLNEMLDSFDVPEDEVIALCGQLSASEKATVLAGGYRSRMASALNVSEMVQAVNNLGPVLSTRLEWVNEASLMTSSINYTDIDDMVRSANQSERDVLKTSYWKDFFVGVCDNATMVEALNDLGFDLATKLTWLQAEMTVTSWELGYATIKPWITDPAADKSVLQTNQWRDFFVSVCDNATMVEALNDLGFDLATRLTWLQAEMTVTSWELDYATIKPWIIDPALDKSVLQTNQWRDFFVKVCDNATMAEAVQDLGFDLKMQLQWMFAEGTDYTQASTIIRAASAGDQATALADQAFLNEIKAAFSWNDFAKCVELLGRSAPSGSQMIADGNVSAGLAVAWNASNAAVTIWPEHDPARLGDPCNPAPGSSPAPTNAHEEGGFIYLNLITGDLSVQAVSAGRQASLPLSNPPEVEDSILVGGYHTHPNVGNCWGSPFFSGADTKWATLNGVPLLMRGAFPTVANTSDHSTGAARQHLAGDRGFPGASGGIAPQATKDEIFDEL